MERAIGIENVEPGMPHSALLTADPALAGSPLALNGFGERTLMGSGQLAAAGYGSAWLEFDAEVTRQ